MNIDPLGAVKSPNKSSLPSEGSHIQGHSPSRGSWSNINQFFPDGCVITPVIPAPSSSSRSVTHSLPSPRLNLKTIVETERDEVFDQQEERFGEAFDQQEESPGVAFDQQTEVPEALTVNTTETIPNSTLTMDTDAYNRKLLQIKLEVDRVDRKRGAYTKDQVNEIDHTRCHVKLDEIQNAEESCQDKIFELIYELDENVEADKARVNTLRSLSDDLRKRVMTNANEVKVRMAEILREKEENKPMSAWEKKNLELKQQEEAKRATIKSNNLLKKIDKCVEKAEN